MLAPPEVREDILAKPELIRQTALPLYSRRVLAAEALSLGLDKQEETAAALERNRLKVLAETALTRRDGAPPEDALVEKLALSQYKANPELYKTQAHVIQLYSKIKPYVKPFGEVKDQIKKDVLRGLARDKRAAINDEIMRGMQLDEEAISALSTRAGSR
ncbi:MAG: hypothetical protein IPL70_12995 [Uliginosibacterium sp.]|nr:hypothetical protein [Uliginosibacterium sp.]